MRPPSNPAFEEPDLICAESVGGFRWHAFASFFTADQSQQMAKFRFGGNDGRFSGVAAAEQAGVAVESETTFLGIRAVAFVAVPCKQWLDFADIVDFVGCRSGCRSWCTRSGCHDGSEQQREKQRAEDLEHGRRPDQSGRKLCGKANSGSGSRWKSSPRGRWAR
jgi:hypothetical protein